MNRPRGKMLIKRIERLIENAESLNCVDEAGVVGIEVEYSDFARGFLEWKVGAENLLVKVNGKEGIYYKNFHELINGPCNTDFSSCISILSALKEEEKDFMEPPLRLFLKWTARNLASITALFRSH